MTCLFLTALLLVGAPVEKTQRTPKEALQPFNELIGSWRGTGMPESGTSAEKRKGFWTETIACDWQFKGDDASIHLTFTQGKYFDQGTLRYLPDKDQFQLKMRGADKQTRTFTGKLEKKVLTLDRDDEQKKETQRLVLTLLHETRFLYRYEVKPRERVGFAKVYQVGATREGVAFAVGAVRPECIVSGGLGTIKVTHKGKDYFVCCTGCRDAFLDAPEKFIKEFEDKKKQK